MPSTTPIAFGLMFLLIGLWLLSAAISNPLALPSKADGADIRGGRAPVRVAFPPGLTGEIDVLTRQDIHSRANETAELLVVNGSGDLVAPQQGKLIPVYVGRGDESHRLAMTIDVPDDHEFVLIAPASWIGHVAFIHHNNPPSVPDWRRIIEAGLIAGASGTVAGVWALRRRRWRQNLAVMKAELAASGYDV